MKKYILGTLLAIAVVMAGSYIQRGYFAFGIEIFFPLIAFALYKVKRASY